MKRTVWTLTAALAAITACAQAPQIDGYESDGKLTFSGATPGKSFTLEFTADLTSGKWTNWSSVTDQPITGAVMALPTPMYFRIKQHEQEGIIADPAFNLRMCTRGYDHNGDMRISQEEAMTVSHLDLQDEAWKNLDLRPFTQIYDVRTAGGQLTTLDISTCTNLYQVWCGGNRLNELDVRNCPNLNVLQCSGNQLQQLDVSQQKNLIDVDCSNNQLTNFTLPYAKVFNHLYCYGNSIRQLDVSACTNMRELYCFGNQLTVLDLHANTNLTYADVKHETDGPLEVIVWNTNKISWLHYSGNRPWIHQP